MAIKTVADLRALADGRGRTPVGPKMETTADGARSYRTTDDLRTAAISYPAMASENVRVRPAVSALPRAPLMNRAYENLSQRRLTLPDSPQGTALAGGLEQAAREADVLKLTGKLSSLQKESGKLDGQYTALMQDLGGFVPTGPYESEAAELRRQITALNRQARETERALVKKQQEAKWARYRALTGAADFERLAARGGAMQNPSFGEAEGGLSMFNWRPFGKEPGNIVTYSRENYDRFRNSDSENRPTVGSPLYHWMTGDEVKLYNYLLAKEGAESAGAFLKDLEETLNSRFGTHQGAQVRSIENPAARTLATGGFGMAAGLDQWAEGMRQLGSEERLPTSPTQFGSAYIREDLRDTGPKIFGSSLGQMGYDVVTTTGNMAPSILVGSLTGGMGVPAVMAQGAGAAALGASAAGNAYNQALGEGYGKDEAMNYAALVGASETTLQYLLGGIGALGGKATGKAVETAVRNIDNALFRIAGTIGVRMAGEGAEEYLQEILEPALRNLAFDERNQIRLVSEDAAYSFLLGALTAGLMEGPGTAGTEFGRARVDSAIDRAYGAMGEHGLFSPEAGAAVQRANRVLELPIFGSGGGKRASPLHITPDGVVMMPGAPIQSKTASTGEAGAYRANRPRNVEYPSVPIINLSMADVAKLNGGEIPTTGNHLRKIAIERALLRLGMDKYPAAYIEASNIIRNGDSYVLKLTKGSLLKMLSPSDGGRVRPESIAVLENIERIAQNGVYFKSERDRQGRDQIAGYDHLMTTVYIDSIPYLVDMRVRIYDKLSGGENRLYYFTPEEVITTRKIDTDLPTGKRRAFTEAQEEASTFDITIPQAGDGVKGESGTRVLELPVFGGGAEKRASPLHITPDGVVMMPGAPGQNKTASMGEAGAYRANRPRNVEYPSVPIINLSMADIVQTGELPRSGNKLRNEAIVRARVRLGLDERSAAYIPASNVLRNGEEYVLKVTKQTLNKMLSPADGGAVPLESIAVLDNLERIANNGVYYKSEGDRKHRQQISGYDHLITTVYIDMQPYLVDMRVRVLQETPVAETQNVLYYFTPEEIVLLKKVDTEPPTGKRHAPTMSRGMHPLNNTIPLVSRGVKREHTQKMLELLSPNGEWIDTFVPWPYNEEKGGTQHGGEEGTDFGGIFGDVLWSDAGREGTSPGVLRSGAETDGRIPAESASQRRNAPFADWAKEHVVQNPSASAAHARARVNEYGFSAAVIDDIALKRINPQAWALTHKGTIYLSNSTPVELSDVIGYHEVVHAVKQSLDYDYLDFMSRTNGVIDFSSDRAIDVLEKVTESRFKRKDLLELSAIEFEIVMDELNTVVWGFYRADPKNARAQFAEVFTDYDAYISELDAIMERVRRQRAEGSTVLDGWDRDIEEGFADEKQPSVKREEDIDRSWETAVTDTEAQEQASLLNAVIKNGQIKLEDVRANPGVFERETAQDIAEVLRAQGYKVRIVGDKANVIKVDNPGGGRNIAQVEISPGGGRHRPNPYVKISTSDQGIIKIVFGNPQTYITDGTEAATIIFAGSEWYD